MLCPTCDKESCYGTFCSECGNLLPQAAVCPVCRKEHKISKFCPVMGIEVEIFFMKASAQKTLEKYTNEILLKIATVFFIPQFIILSWFEIKNGHGVIEYLLTSVLACTLSSALASALSLPFADSHIKARFKKKYPEHANYVA